MSVACIICEYNPFHNGHEYLIKKAKEDGHSVVAVMSGNYTQRGELAFADKYIRAEAAVKCGADLVLELPFPFCMSSAEFFAKGGVSVIERVGADAIYFGSESGDVDFIKEAARVAASEEFLKAKGQLSHDDGVAKGYFEALGELLGKDVEMLSNDILGVEYLKEINRRGFDISPIAVTRVGDGYRDEKINSDFASATAIRKFLLSGEVADMEKYMPKESLECVKNALENSEAPVDVKKIETSILSFWRMVDPATLADIAELGNGLEYRIKDAALSSVSLDDFVWRASTKKYTYAKIRRAILFGILGVTKADLDGEPQYTCVLGANKVGREILSRLRKVEGDLKIVTKPADAPDCRQNQLSLRADALYTLAMPTPKGSAYLASKKIYIEE